MMKESDARGLTENENSAIAMTYTVENGVIYHCGAELREMFLCEVAGLRLRKKGKNDTNVREG